MSARCCGNSSTSEELIIERKRYRDRTFHRHLELNLELRTMTLAFLKIQNCSLSIS